MATECLEKKCEETDLKWLAAKGKNFSKGEILGEIPDEARLCVNDKEESYEAIRLLREAGFSVSSLCLPWLYQPELAYGSFVFSGIHEIKKFIQYYKISEQKLAMAASACQNAFSPREL